jgi:Toprim domain
MTSAAELTRRLGGRWQGRYGIARCIAHGDHNPSLSIIDGERGPILTCFAGCDWRDIRAELQRRGLLEGKTRQPPRIRFIGKPSSQDRSKRRQHEKATWLWSQRRPIEGTLAECYLRGRGYSGVIPKTLAFLPPSKPEHHPAMIAAYALVDEPEPGVLGSPCNVQAIHLTLLRPDGSGKADIDHPKLTISSPRGRPIALSPPNDLLGLAITEGIEDALTVHEATGLGAWAAGSAPMMPALAYVLPGYIEAVTIYAHDDAGRQYALQLADRLWARGIEPFVEGLAL